MLLHRAASSVDLKHDLFVYTPQMHTHSMEAWIVNKLYPAETTLMQIANACSC